MRIYLDASPTIDATACDMFLTNDAGLKAFPQITVEVVS